MFETFYNLSLDFLIMFTTERQVAYKYKLVSFITSLGTIQVLAHMYRMNPTVETPLVCKFVKLL